MKITNEGKLGIGSLIADLGQDSDADDTDAEPRPDRALDLPTYGPDVTAVTALTVPDDGAWTHASDPHAIHGGGITVFGYVDMTNGNIEVRSVDDATGTVSASFTLHAALDVDTHAAPAVIFRPDGRIVAAYSAHRGATMYVRVSTNPYDVSAWGSEQDLDATLGGRKYTYPTLAYLNNDLYLWYRDNPAADTNSAMAYSVSSSDGDSGTWAAQTIAYQNGTGTFSYWKIESSATRFHIAVIDDRVPPPAASIYHFTFDGTTYRKSDGTSAGSAPLDPSDITLVYDGTTDGFGWAMDVYPDDTNPTFVYAVGVSMLTNSFRYARWDGAAWVSSVVVDTNGFIASDSGQVFAIGIILDGPFTAYANVKVGSFWEVQQFTTDDDGATWTKTEDVTTGSSDDNLFVARVRDHAPGLQIIWLYGTYTDDVSGGLGVKAWTTGSEQMGFSTDGDDATYDTIVGGTDVLRIDLGTTYRIVRSRLLIGSESAGSRTYSIYGATLADFSDEVLLDSSTYAATGTFTPDDIALSWADDGIARRFFRLEGTAETRRVYSFELYEASNNLADYATLDDLDAVDAEIDAHIVDTSDAHDASAVSFTPAAGLSSTNVQDAIEEVAGGAGRWELAVIPGSPPDPLYADGDYLYIFVP